ncbi:hypothetical protein LCGC14_2827480, partial [marine sediment metagenome]
MILPTERTKTKSKNPKKLLIYSIPKAGKTTILAGLENALIVDLEGGTDYVDAMSVPAPHIDLVSEVMGLLKKGHK